MKKLFLILLPALMSSESQALPYIQGLWTKRNPVYFSQGVILMPSSLDYDRTFTNVAVLYHPLSAGSIIPYGLRTYMPPESWACTVGAGYAPREGGGGSVGFGCGFNLLDSARAWGAQLLQKSSNGTVAAIGKQIAPGSGPVNLYVSRQWDDSQVHPLRFAPRWFFGASFGF